MRGYLSKDLADRFLVAGAELEGEQRQVTILFVDLVQSTQIMRALGGERMAELLDELMGSIAKVVFSFEASVVNVAGDGVLCIFGAPIAHEDDPERSLRAALAIQRSVPHLTSAYLDGTGQQAQMRMGIHTGVVVLRTIGQGYRLTYTAIGDAVHVAQRLQSVAAPGEILVSVKTQRLAATPFRFSPPETLTLKGFDDEHVAVRLLGERDTAERRPLDASETAFVGRATDLAAVQTCIDRLTAGLGGVLTIVGDAGIGKSRLLSEARRRNESAAHWLMGRALSYAQNAPYSVIGQQIRRAARIGNEDTEQSARQKLHAMVLRECGGHDGPAVYPFIATALGMRLEDPEAALVESYSGDTLQSEVFRALGSLIRGVARRTPVVLVFEDLHWSDRTSIAAIDSLLPLIEDWPILYVLVARPDTDAPSWVLRQKIETIYAHRHTSIMLGPLSQDASTSLAMSLLKTDRLPTDVRELVLRKAEGIPLFVEELTKSFVEGGVLEQHLGIWRLTIPHDELRAPDTLQGIILARIDRLEDPLKRTLQIASVAGPTIIRRVLAAVSDDNSDLPRRLRGLERLELIREARRQPEVEYVFKHALIQDVAYESMLRPRRTKLHQRVAEAFEIIFADRRTEFQSIIAEHFLRGEVWEKAADYLLGAGDEATRLYAHAEARQHYAKAMDSLAHLADTVENRRRRVDTITKRVSVAVVAESPEQHISRLAEAERLVRSLPAAGGTRGADQLRLARIHYWLGRAHNNRGDPAQAVHYYQQVLAVAQEVGDAELMAVPALTLGQALCVQGQWAKAKPLIIQAVESSERIGNWVEWARSVGYLGLVTAACGDYATGLAEARRGLARARELNSPTHVGLSNILLCATYLMNEDMVGIAEAGRAAAEAAEQSGDLILLYAGHAFRGWAEARLGQQEHAVQSMARSDAVRERLGRVILEDWFAVGKADIALQAERHGEALALAEEAVAVGQRVGSVFTGGLAHRVWAQALAIVDPGNGEAMEAHMTACLRALESGEARLQMAHSQLIWGLLCFAHKDIGQAFDHWQEAAKQFETMGLGKELAKAQALIARIT